MAYEEERAYWLGTKRGVGSKADSPSEGVLLYRHEGLCIISRNFSFLLLLSLSRDLLPLDVGLVVSTSRDQILIFRVGLTVPESNFWDVLSVTGKSPAICRVVQDWPLVYANRASIVTRGNQSSVAICINSINVRTVRTLMIHAHNFPAELTCACDPHVCCCQSRLAFFYMFLVFQVEVQFRVGLINGSDVSGILWPIKTGNCWWEHHFDCPMRCVLPRVTHLVDVDVVVVWAYCKKFIARWIPQYFAPFFRCAKRSDFLGKIIVLNDCNVTVVVADNNMTKLFAVC